MPSELTVTSIAIPGFANAGSSAVIAIAATFFALSDVGSMVTPSRLSILVSAPLTAGDWVSSPVPARPTTMPNPVMWLSRTPAIVVRSLTRSACATPANASTVAMTAMVFIQLLRTAIAWTAGD